MLTIEFEPPQESEPCECCGGRTTALTRFVYRDGDANSIYYARFSNNHPERVVLFKGSLVDPRLRASNELTAEPSKLARISFPWNGTRASPIAAVERGPFASSPSL